MGRVLRYPWSLEGHLRSAQSCLRSLFQARCRLEWDRFTGDAHDGAYCNRGLASMQLGHYDETLVDYVVAIDRDPQAHYCYFNRGSLYLTLGEFQKAIDDFTEALGERRNDPVRLDAARASL